MLPVVCSTLDATNAGAMNVTIYFFYHLDKWKLLLRGI